MTKIVLLCILVALTNCLTIRTQTKISLNNTKSPSSTQLISSHPQKQQQPINPQLSNTDKNNLTNNLIVTTITRVYPDDGEEYYEYQQILPLKDIKKSANITLITQGNQTTGTTSSYPTLIFPNSNEKEKGNISTIPQIINKEDINKENINKNSSNLNESKSQNKQKGKDTMGILPIPIIYNKNDTDKKNEESQKSKSGTETQKTKEQILPAEKEGQSKDKQNKQNTKQNKEKQIKQEIQNSTKNNEIPTNLLPFNQSNSTNKPKQSPQQKKQPKQNNPKILPIVVPFQTNNNNQTQSHNSTKQNQKNIQNQNNNSFIPIIPFNPNNNQKQNQQHPKNKQSNNKTTQSIINTPQKNQKNHENKTQVEIPSSESSKNNQNQENKNSSSNTPIPFPSPFAVPITNNTQNVTTVTQNKQKESQSSKQSKSNNLPIILPTFTNSTENSQNRQKQQNNYNPETNHSNPIIKPFSKQQNNSNQTKVTPIIPIPIPNNEQHNKTDNTHPNPQPSPIQHNNTNPITNKSVTVVPPITSPGQMPPKTTPQKASVSQSITMVSFSCDKATDQLKKDTCNNQTGCNMLWDQYKKNCEKSGGNMLVMFGPSSTSINSKEELSDLLQKK